MTKACLLLLLHALWCVSYVPKLSPVDSDEERDGLANDVRCEKAKSRAEKLM